MKKLISAVCALLCCTVLFAACSSSTESPAASEQPSQSAEESGKIRIAALKGPTGIGMVELMDEAEEKGYEFQLVNSADEITSLVTSGSVDIAAAPTNLAAALYNKTSGGVKLAALNTLGVLYVLDSTGSVNSVSDLSGKTLYVSGQGAVPEYALAYILDKNGVTDCTIEWVSDHSELATMCASGEVELAMLPQPNVTAVLSKNQDMKIALDVTEEWDKVSDNGSVLTMGCLMVTKDFAENHKEELDAFLDDYKASVESVNTDVDSAAELVEKYEIMASAALAKQAIPTCNIVFVEGQEMKEKISGFYEVLFNANAKSVGGALPDDAFYYVR